MAAAVIELADGVRAGVETADAYQIWTAANRGADGSPTRRRELYREAMIHAGLLLTARGKRYARCPICRSSLAR